MVDNSYLKNYLLVQTSLHILYPEYVDEQATMETKLNVEASMHVLLACF